jgi:serine/threonine protein phosphatase PrpC
VGRGDLASRTSCDVLTRSFGPQSTLDSFTTSITAVCHQAARALLDWAVGQGYRQRLADGQDLMGTTLTAGWLEGNRLALANLGDSRAYLLNAGGIEQLTVDGDLGSALLAAGVPPEDVREIGSMAKALRDCIGGYTRSPIGELRIQEQHCTPTVTTWRLLPGDFVVLCTDGLVEEGVFLDPPALTELLGRHKDQSAQALAVKLADAADALQRPPTPQEPDGFGDNISCIVIKVLGP